MNAPSSDFLWLAHKESLFFGKRSNEREDWEEIISIHIRQMLYRYSATNQQTHRVLFMPILQTRKRKFNLLEIEWFADYVDTGAGIQTYNVLLQNPGLLPYTTQLHRNKGRKRSDSTKATLLKSKNREVQLLSLQSFPHFFKETKWSFWIRLF